MTSRSRACRVWATALHSDIVKVLLAADASVARDDVKTAKGLGYSELVP